MKKRISTDLRSTVLAFAAFILAFSAPILAAKNGFAAENPDVVINEIHPSAQTGGKWVEIYNLSNNPVAIDNWVVERGGGVNGKMIAERAPAGAVIAAKGFYVFEANGTSSALAQDSGDLPVILWTGTHGRGAAIDSALYGAVPGGKSFSRIIDGGADFAIADSTKGMTNSALPIIDSVVPTNTNLRGIVTFAPTVSGVNLSYTYMEWNRAGVWLTDNTKPSDDAAKPNRNWANGAQLTINTAKYPDGNYQLKINTVDAQGRTATKIVPYSIDNTASILKITTPTVNSWNEKTFAINGTATDANGVVDNQVELHVRPVNANGKCGGFANTVFATVNPDGSWTANVDGTSFVDGEYCVTAFATDTFGNQANPAGVSLKSFYIDNHAPVVTTNLVDGQVLTGVVKISEFIDEKYPKAYNIRILDAAGRAVQIDGKNAGAYDAKNLNGELSVDLDTTKMPDGMYKIQFSATDLAGHSVTKYIVVHVDNTAPIISIDSAQITDSGALIIGTINKEITPVVTIDGVIISGITIVANGDGTHGWMAIVGDKLAVGEHKIVATAGDNLGRIATINSVLTVAKTDDGTNGDTGGGTTNGGIGVTPVVSATTNSTPNNVSQATNSANVGESVIVTETETTSPATNNVSQPLTEQGEVLGAKTTNDDANDLAKKCWLWGCAPLGVCWYWWAVGLIIVIAIVWWLIARRRRDNDSPISDDDDHDQTTFRSTRRR